VSTVTAGQNVSASYQESDMNSDQIEGTIKDAAGKVQRKAGEAVGS